MEDVVDVARRSRLGTHTAVTQLELPRPRRLDVATASGLHLLRRPDRPYRARTSRSRGAVPGRPASCLSTTTTRAVTVFAKSCTGGAIDTVVWSGLDRLSRRRGRRRRRRRRRCREHCEQAEGERAPHASAPRAMTRRSAQRRNEARTSPGSCEPTIDGLDAERAEVPRQLVPPLLVREPLRVGLRRGEVDGDDAPGRGIGVRDRDPADGREALLPDTGPGSRPARAPSGARARAARPAGPAARGSRRGRRRTPASAGRALVPAEMLEPERDASAGASNGRSNVPGSAHVAAARRHPEHVAVARVVDVAGEAASGACARADQLDASRAEPAACRATATSRGQSPIDGRRSATTTTRGDSSAKSSWTTNSSLVPAARESRRGRPVDPGDVVAGAVLARAGEVGAASSSRAAHAAEREADRRAGVGRAGRFPPSPLRRR